MARVRYIMSPLIKEITNSLHIYNMRIKRIKNVCRSLRQIKFFCPIMHSLGILLKEYLKYLEVALTPSRCVMTQSFPFL